MKYHVPDEDVDGWTELGFNDTNWKKGITSIGYGDGDDNTEIKSGEVWLTLRALSVRCA